MIEMSSYDFHLGLSEQISQFVWKHSSVHQNPPCYGHCFREHCENVQKTRPIGSWREG